MRSKTRPVLLLSALLLSIMVFQGCAIFGKGGSGQGPQAAQNATAVRGASDEGATLQTVQNDYLLAEVQTEATQDALDELAISPIADLQQAYDYFSEQAKSMLEMGEPLLAHADGLHFQGPSYLVETQRLATACPIPGQRESVDQQIAELGVYFNAVAEDAWEVKRAYREYQFDISQIREALYGNVTPASVDSMNKFIAKAAVDSDSLKEALEQAQDAVAVAQSVKAQNPKPVD